MITRIHKTINGWRAQTDIPLSTRRVLRILSHKTNGGGVHTYASVHHEDGGYLAHVMFQDYSNTVIHAPLARCTERTIREQHGSVLACMLDDIKAKVAAHYDKATSEA